VSSILAWSSFVVFGRPSGVLVYGVRDQLIAFLFWFDVIYPGLG